MSLTKETAIDQITVTENGTVLVREATIVKENDVVLAKTYHRTSFAPGENLTNQPEKVVAVCEAVWTPQVVDEYKTQQANSAA